MASSPSTERGEGKRRVVKSSPRLHAFPKYYYYCSYCFISAALVCNTSLFFLTGFHFGVDCTSIAPSNGKKSARSSVHHEFPEIIAGSHSAIVEDAKDINGSNSNGGIRRSPRIRGASSAAKMRSKVIDGQIHDEANSSENRNHPLKYYDDNNYDNDEEGEQWLKGEQIIRERSDSDNFYHSPHYSSYLENSEDGGLDYLEHHRSTLPRGERRMDSLGEQRGLLVPEVSAIVDGEDSLLGSLHNENKDYQQHIRGPLRLGAHVSLSKDGSTIAIGSPLTCTGCSAYDMNGIVQIYRRHNNTATNDNESIIDSSWEKIGQLIEGNESNHHLGMSISLSSDGNIVAIGTYAGYAKVYQYTQLDAGPASWIQLGQVLSLFDQSDVDTDTDTNASNSTVLTFGRSVSLSDAGDLIAIISVSHVFVYQLSQNQTEWKIVGDAITIDPSTNLISNVQILSTNEETIVAFGVDLNPQQQLQNTATSVKVFQLKNVDTTGWEQIGQDITLSDISALNLVLCNNGRTIAMGYTRSPNENSIPEDSLGSSSDSYQYLDQVYHLSRENEWVQLSQIIGDRKRSTSVGGEIISLSQEGTILAVTTKCQRDYGNNELYSCVKVYKLGSQDDSVSIIHIIPANIKGVNFGGTVSLSGDGSTLVIGEPHYNNFLGRLMIYDLRKDKSIPAITLPTIASSNYLPKASTSLSSSISSSNEAEWVQIGKNIEDDFSGFAVSNDATTVAIGSYDNGFVKVFKNTGENWKQVGQSIRNHNDDGFGINFSLSGNGNVIAIGATQWYFSEQYGQYTPGHVHIYHFENGKWTKMGEISQGENDFDEKDFIHSDYFGSSVSLSNDGSRLAIGTRNRVYVYEADRDEGVSQYEWTQLGEYVSVSEGIDLYGTAVKIAGENNTMVVSTPKERKVKILQLDQSWKQIGGDIINAAPLQSDLSISDDGEIIAGFFNHSLHVFDLNLDNEWVELDQGSDADVNTEIMLNNLTIAALHRLTGRYVYSIEGLLVKYEAFNLNHPCTPGLRSRWELKELSDCNQTELHGDTYSTLYDLLMESKDKNMYIRDIFFPEEGLNCNADDIESEIEIEVQGSCWQRVHDEHLSIFDVSSISNCL